MDSPRPDPSTYPGHTPIDIALREGNHSLAAVLTGVQNRQRNDLHVAFDAGPSLEDQQLRLLDCRPELAAQRDPEGNLPLHVGAAAGLSIAVLEKCSEVYKEGPTRRNAAGARRAAPRAAPSAAASPPRRRPSVPARRRARAARQP